MATERIPASNRATSLLGTHVVVGIKWGANVVITFEQQASSAEEASQLKGSLEGGMSFMLGLLSAQGGGQLAKNKTLESATQKYSLTVYGDVLPNDALPMTPQEAVEFLRQVPSLVAAANDGKGVPLEYELVPLSALHDLELGQLAAEFHRGLAESTLLRIRRFVEEIESAAASFRDTYDSVKRIAGAVPRANGVLLELARFGDQIAGAEAEFRAQVGEKLAEIRGTANDAEAADNKLESLIADYEKGPCSLNKVLGFWNSKVQDANEAELPRPAVLIINDMRRKYGTLADLGVRFLSEDSAVATMIYGVAGHVYVLYTKASWERGNAAAAYKANLKAFLRLARQSRNAGSTQGTNTKCWMVNLDIYETIPEEYAARTSPWIEKYDDMELVEADYVATNPSGSTCVATRHVQRQEDFKPEVGAPSRVAGVFVRARCPASILPDATCQPLRHYWKCGVCHILFKKYMFPTPNLRGGLLCACGWTKLTAINFRCNGGGDAWSCPGGSFTEENYSLFAV